MKLEPTKVVKKVKPKALLAPKKNEKGEKVISKLVIETRNYHTIGIYFTIRHCIKMPQHVFTMMMLVYYWI